MSNVNTKISVLVVMATALSACGGGGGGGGADGGTGDSAGGTGNPPPTNSAPVARAVSITDMNAGELVVGDALLATYEFSDADGDQEGNSVYQWHSDGIPIGGATSLTYTVGAGDEGSDLSILITPVAASGTASGTPAASNSLTVSASRADTCEDINTPDTDEDSDGLPDCYERFIGTSVVDVDSDGDNLTDFDEVVTKAFDPTINNYQFNPRIADVPDISVTFQQLPDITINYTTSEGTSQTQGVTRSTESARTLTTSQTQQQSTSEELSATLGSSGGSSGFDVSSSTTYSQSVQNSLSWTQEQTRENRQSLSRMQETTSTSGVTTENGTIAVSLRVRNRGYQTITIDNLTVTAFEVDANDPSRQRVVSGMDYDTAFGSFPTFDIGPNASSNTLPYTANISLGKTYSLLEDSRNLSIEPTTWRITDQDGRSYTHNLTNVQARSAQVIIDYGNQNNLEIEKYYVATVTDFQRNRLSAATILSEVLRVPYAEAPAPATANNGVVEVRGVASEESASSRWIVLHNYISADGISRERTRYDPNDGAFSLDDILIAKGEVLHFLYVADEDLDGVATREEFLNGTNPNAPDTDRDGLTDFEEIKVGWELPVTASLSRRVYSDPLQQDADNDGVIDSIERLQGTHPFKRDTDNDGVIDFSDSPIVLEDMQEVAFFPLDEDQLVAPGLTNPTAVAMVAGEPTTDRFGRSNRAINITADEHYVDLDGFFTEAPEHGATIVFWMQINPNMSSAGYNLYEHRAFTERNQAEQFMWLYPSGMTLFGNPFDRYSFFSTWDDGVVQFPFADWHMVAVVGAEPAAGEGMRSFRVYFNGEFFGERKQPPDRTLVHFFTLPWLFAGPSSYNVGLQEYRGKLDDVRFFKRSLDEEELHLLYEASQ